MPLKESRTQNDIVPAIKTSPPPTPPPPIFGFRSLFIRVIIHKGHLLIRVAIHFVLYCFVLYVCEFVYLFVNLLICLFASLFLCLLVFSPKLRSVFSDKSSYSVFRAWRHVFFLRLTLPPSFLPLFLQASDKMGRHVTASRRSNRLLNRAQKWTIGIDHPIRRYRREMRKKGWRHQTAARHKKEVCMSKVYFILMAGILKRRLIWTCP